MKKFFESIENGFNNICLILSKGFFFYFVLLSELLYKIFPLSIFEKSKLFFKRRQNDASAFLFVVFLVLIGLNVYVRFYDGNEVKYVSKNNVVQKKMVLDKTELNLYKRYSKIDINSVSINKLKKTNKDIVSWITVDGTNINYPVVQGKDNNYYLSHDIEKNVKASGWVFMDYRNSFDMSDDNTIFYGHNLANKTSFGSLENVFKSDWFETSNHYIEVINEKDKYIYEIFSVYTIDPEVYYLQNNFNNKEEYYNFLNTLKSRSIYKFDVDLDKSSKIITLSTCTNDNKNRNVVHAKLIEK
jgi:sortase B